MMHGQKNIKLIDCVFLVQSISSINR